MVASAADSSVSSPHRLCLFLWVLCGIWSSSAHGGVDVRLVSQVNARDRAVASAVATRVYQGQRCIQVCAQLAHWR